MIDALHVLSIGTTKSSNIVRDVLLSRTRCWLFVARKVWDLSAILASVNIDVAILHGRLSAAELRSCSVYIRHHWPDAKILLIHAHTKILDDPMYDEQMRPDSSAGALLTMIEQLAACAKRETGRY